MNAHPDSITTLAAEAQSAFRHAFGRDPNVLVSAPGRVNLIGDHTDYNDGFVLPMAIDRRTLVAGAVRGAHGIGVVSSAFGRGGEDSDFARFVDAVAYELCDLGWKLPGIDVLIHSDVPIGAGLASSAALTVATATMFEVVVGATLSPVDKALLCQRAEHRSGTPCGIMDMFVATHAQRDCALLLDCRTMQLEHVPLSGDCAWLIVNTGVRHALSDGAYAMRRTECQAAATGMGVASLRDGLGQNITSLEPTLLRRARHVISENDRVLRAARALRERDKRTMGRLMVESHASLRDDFEVSCPELDAVVALVQTELPRLGHGARMTGGGFGGCVVVLCEASEAGRIRVTLENELRTAIGLGIEVYAAAAGHAACQLGRNGGEV